MAMDAEKLAKLEALLDKQEITELLTRYLRSVDRGDGSAASSPPTPSTPPADPGTRGALR